MTKSILRVLVVIVVTAAVVLVGREGIVWANSAQTPAIANAPQAPVAAPRGGNPGTVKAPPTSVGFDLVHTGGYSVQGFCSITVLVTAPGDTATAVLVHPLPSGVPVHPVRLGCNVTFYSGVTVLPSVPGGTVQICFAAVPNHTTTIAFYNPTLLTWTSLLTTTGGGLACADGNASGIYVATFK
ncbi:MAG TPA: hypothetical protein VLZ89_17975 [Anaerolineales bacterium]|nr:hypothetical protein [Anaerolineales bacterium]